MLLDNFTSVFSEDEKNEVVKLSTVLENLTIAYTVTKTNIPKSIGLIRDFSAVDSKTKKDTEKALAPLAKRLGVKNTKSTDTILTELSTFVVEVNKEIGTLTDLVEKDFSKVVALNTITAKQAALLGVSNALLSSALFLEDFFLFLTYKIGDDKLYYKVKEKNVEAGIEAFSKLYKQYKGKVRDEILEINSLSNTEVGESSAMFRANASKADKDFSIPIDRFTSSPIYFIRKWWVDFQVSRNEAMVDKKQLMELKLLDLKARAKGERNINIQEQIEYYEKKITKYEAAIKDFEEE